VGRGAGRCKRGAVRLARGLLLCALAITGMAIRIESTIKILVV
jgi:hypothetical protein